MKVSGFDWLAWLPHDVWTVRDANSGDNLLNNPLYQRLTVGRFAVAACKAIKMEMCCGTDVPLSLCENRISAEPLSDSPGSSFAFTPRTAEGRIRGNR